MNGVGIRADRGTGGRGRLDRSELRYGFRRRQRGSETTVAAHLFELGVRTFPSAVRRRCLGVNGVGGSYSTSERVREPQFR
ncbi:hypothetical protein [Halopiger djelfimassiliensis]|uniref:hypothetical protein n=1 Tax=Halopiger djelfimassiliensis TaxID=1293047 RepID=UPI0012B5AF31|nr:hypothetical protein [Halopiger djelfimassiliensis]